LIQSRCLRRPSGANHEPQFEVPTSFLRSFATPALGGPVPAAIKRATRKIEKDFSLPLPVALLEELVSPEKGGFLAGNEAGPNA